MTAARRLANLADIAGSVVIAQQKAEQRAMHVLLVEAMLATDALPACAGLVYLAEYEAACAATPLPRRQVYHAGERYGTMPPRMPEVVCEK